ncbi:MAG: dihydroxyacetone kinase subunit DhaK [Tropicimonas sp.]|uniref:dihydroxyacetone kinase subunit DhaK n=1 Tax=Tropicimonas sp. TaxID=2067044 RepID=UPI003A8B0B00
MAKHFINTVEGFVDDAIDGLLRGGAGEGLARLDAPTGIRVVLRDPLPQGRVALVSGGGSGHEPAHAGFVGAGMLSAAICGDIFSSPPVDAVLAALRAVTGPAGAVLIVKNYTGDRLNFGLAAERARAEGLAVEMVLVSDDIALPDAPQARGLAGTLLVHKIAGAAAEAGADLATVAALARRVAEQVRTIGLSLTSCAIPGQDSADRIAGEEAEFGLGIHGEPGAGTIPLTEARTLMEPLQAALIEATGGAGDLALVVNMLGGVPPIEAQVIAEAVLTGPLAERAACVIGPAPFMTALDMRGVSLSVLPLDAELRALLDAPAGPVSWMPARALAGPKLIPLPATSGEVAPPPSDDPETRAMIETICATVAQMAPDLDALDARVGDGDTGSSFAAGARDLDARTDSLPLADPAALFVTLGRVLTQRMGGSAGVLLSILFSAAGHQAEAGEAPARALRLGLERMKELGGAARGDRTMIDALEPALDALVAGGSLDEAARAARAGAEETARMTGARAGRSAYVPGEHLSGNADPGAEGVARLFEALAANV